MHIYLTGDIQIGKSTAINRALELMSITPGGFRTIFSNRQSESRRLHICPAAGTQKMNDGNTVVEFSPGGLRIFPDRFDSLGSELLRAAREDSSLIIMDECGRFEKNSPGFIDEVYRCLDCGKPILGVLREWEISWLERIKSHPDVHLITVSAENRDSLPEIIAAQLLPQI